MQEFKVGDRVKVRGHSFDNQYYSNSDGFDNCWCYDMDDYVGKEFTIQNIDPYAGITFEKDAQAFMFPPAALELIEEVITKKEKNMFKVGQKVWCVATGEGTVSSIIDEGSNYPVNVKFSTGLEEFYTGDGKLFLSGNRTLFFSPPIISAETEPPFVSTLVGKKVLLESNKVDFMEIVTVLDETADKIYTDSFVDYWCKDAVTVYEITPVTFKD